MGAMDQLEPIEKAGVDELRALQLDTCAGACGTRTKTCRTIAKPSMRPAPIPVT